MRSISRTHRTRSVLFALGLYLSWTILTYLLEGRLQTFLRPDAMGARFTYAIIANMTIGIAGGMWLIGRFVLSGLITPSLAGFKAGGRAGWSVLIGLILGFAFYALQGAPSWDPVVLGNVFAQVLVVSTAEIMVCWVVFGSVLAELLKVRSTVGAYASAVVASSVLFGLYHFAHSPPFNTLSMVLLLSGIGLATGLFYFVSRNVYGTVAFHNMLAVYGIVNSLAAEGALVSFERPIWPLIGTAFATVLLLVGGHAWLRGKARQASKLSFIT